LDDVLAEGWNWLSIGPVGVPIPFIPKKDKFFSWLEEAEQAMRRLCDGFAMSL